MIPITFNIVENKIGEFPQIAIYNIPLKNGDVFNFFLDSKQAFNIYATMLLKCDIDKAFIRELLWEYSLGLTDFHYSKELNKREFQFTIFFDEDDNVLILTPCIDGNEMCEINLKINF